jgi:uncharacterized caspase-like protein
MVMLDLAYDGPFGKQGQPLAPGLAIVEPDPNMLISFNTAPGAYAPIPKGDYGPYAQAISETFRIAGLPVDDIFARVRTRTAELTKSGQIPWHASRMDPNYQLMERAPDAPALPVSPAQRQESRARPIRTPMRRRWIGTRSRPIRTSSPSIRAAPTPRPCAACWRRGARR